MVKAVIEVSGKQYFVEEKQSLLVDLLSSESDTLAIKPLLVIDGDKVKVGKPFVDESEVKAKIVNQEVKGDKIRVIRYKSKKRVHKENGHRQKYTELLIESIK